MTHKMQFKTLLLTSFRRYFYSLYSVVTGRLSSYIEC